MSVAVKLLAGTPHNNKIVLAVTQVLRTMLCFDSDIAHPAVSDSDTIAAVATISRVDGV